MILNKYMLLILGISFFLSLDLNGQKDSIVNRLLEEGKELYYAGEYENAKQSFLDALSRKENQSTPDSQLMIIYKRLGVTDRYLRSHRSALINYELGQSIAEQLYGVGSEEVADFLFEIASVFSQMYDPIKANEYYSKCLEIYQSIYGEVSSQVGRTYMSIGVNYSKMGQYEDANAYYQRAFDIFQESSEPGSQDFNRIYSNWGYNFRKMGNFDRAIEYGKKALEIKLLHYAPNHPGVAKYHGNLGKAYLGKGEPETALPYFQKSLEIYKKAYGDNHPNLGGSYAELGGVYADLKQYDRALELYEKGNAIQAETMESTHPYAVGGFYNIGAVYEDMGNLDKALNYYIQTLKKFQAAPYAPPSLIAGVHYKIGTVYLKKHDYESALETIRKGKGFLHDDSGRQVQDRLGILNLLDLEVKILTEFFQQKKLDKGLGQIYKAVCDAVEIMAEIKKEPLSIDDTELVFSQGENVLKSGVTAAFQLYENTGLEKYLIKAFEFSDQSRSNVLWRSLHTDYALGASGIPPEELEVFEGLKARLSAAEEVYYFNPTPESQMIYLNLKIKYEQLIDSWEIKYPEYYVLKYAPSIPIVNKIQENLSTSKSGLVEYFMTETDLYVFVIQQSGIFGEKIKLRTDLELLINQFRLKDVSDIENNSSGYITILSDLYNVLIHPISKDLKDLNQLVIIPSGQLHYVSFECLVSSDIGTDFRSLSYLIQDYSISYFWSAGLFQMMNYPSSESVLEYVGFAPSFGGNPDAGGARADLSTLPFAQTEIERSAQFFSGESIIGDQASKANFRQEAPKGSILHLASHAILHNDNPLKSGIYFSGNEFLTAREIYNLDLTAELAVISACNTGYGKLSLGEGALSLGRAFTYAGCKSVMMNLWLANDKSSAEIISTFYSYLKKGEPKDVALRHAKLDFLATADALTAHPYFWSNLVLVGEADKMSSTSPTWFWWLGISVLAIGGFYFLYKSAKRL